MLKNRHKPSRCGTMVTTVAACLAAAMMLWASAAKAESVGLVRLVYYLVEDTGAVYFRTDNPAPPNTCSYYGNQFRFVAISPEGRNLLATLVAAKLNSREIAIIYAPSSAPGSPTPAA